MTLIFVPYLSILHSKESGIIKFSLNYPFSMFFFVFVSLKIVFRTSYNEDNFRLAATVLLVVQECDTDIYHRLLTSCITIV